MQHNTLKSNPISLNISPVDSVMILLPLIFPPSFGLSVVLGTLREAGGVRETFRRLLYYSVSGECWMKKNCPRGKNWSIISNRFMARMICFACQHPLKLPASTINETHLCKSEHSSTPCTKSWDGRVKAAPTLAMKLFLWYVLFAVSVPNLSVSFCLIRNFTMFSLVKNNNTKLCVQRNNEAAIPI